MPRAEMCSPRVELTGARLVSSLSRRRRAARSNEPIDRSAAPPVRIAALVVVLNSPEHLELIVLFQAAAATLARDIVPGGDPAPTDAAARRDDVAAALHRHAGAGRRPARSTHAAGPAGLLKLRGAAASPPMGIHHQG